MSHDSPHRVFSLFAPSEAATQQDSVGSYGCTHCVLIFKTRFYLYEHLHQVHGLSIEAALKESGLKSVPQNKPKLDSKSKNKIIKSDFAFNCKNCSFKSRNWSIFSEHKKQCSGTSGNESPLSTANALFKQQKSPTGSTQKGTSKDVKIYSKSPQTITKYFTAASSLKSDQAKEKDPKTLRLEDSSLKSCGVFQVTATSIDMVQGSKNASHLLNDLISDPTSAKPVDPFKEATLNNASKRTSKESEVYNPSKKAKLETDKTNHNSTSNCADLSFEVSDDEEANNLVCEEPEVIKFYFCKHCDFKSASLEHVYNHYEENHPYLRYNSFYIEEKSDQSATFRCLECPNEFSSDALLRNHYNKNHADSPDIFCLKSSDLNLVYKCFVCPFTSSILQSLREHHKQKHPSHKVENQLLYCKYSSPQHTASRKFSQDHESLEIPQPERTTLSQDEPSPSSSPKLKLKAQDGNLYYCEKCTFSHKSVVVLHVHYKKCHPEEPITLDKIKQSVGTLSVTASAQKTDVEIDLSHSTVDEESFTSAHSNISESISVDRNSQPALLTESDTLTSPINDKMFFCDRCDFSNTNIKSVVSHHNAKHGFTTTIEDILRYTAAIESGNVVKVGSVSNSEASVCLSPQDLYYCQVCNYGNPSLKGLVNHQNKVHDMVRSKEHILEYTAKIRDQIEKSKSHPTISILPSGLPLPVVRGKSFNFCYLCNYRHKDSIVISRHFFKVHKGCRLNSKQIAEHTSLIYERLQESSQIKSTEENQAAIPTHAKKKIITKTSKSRHVPPSEARLKCSKCSYAANHLYLMRKHLIHWHKTKMSFSDLVLRCGSGAHFEPGYYCDTCSFLCGGATEVKSHTSARHSGRSLSIPFISTQLYLSADICDPTTRSNSVNNDTPDEVSPETYPEAYSCTACSFKGTSFSSITSHYQAVHPSTVKEGSSLLDVGSSTKKKIFSNKEQDCNDSKRDFDSYQVPIDSDNLKVSKEKTKGYSCSHCPARFSQHGGLVIHIGMKHRDKIEKAPQLPKRMQIFKCRSCSYVNYLRCGVLSHAKIKHPNKASKSDSFYVEREHLKNVEMKVKNGNWKFCGYICKECSQIYSSKEKLNEHRKTHKPSVVTSVTLARENSKPIEEEDIWCQYCGLYCATAKDLSDHLLVCQKNNTTYPCVLCSNAFCTKVQLGIHYTRKHGEKAFFKHYAPVYNQPSDKTTAQQKEIANAKVSIVSQTEKLRMFKCPSCRYVNSRHHGTLTHSQMRHPKIVVRAETLKTVEIDVANMIGYLPSAKSYGGFRCRKCPLIYGQLKKLKKHCEKDHSSRAQATSQLSAHTQQLPAVQNVTSESAPSSQTQFVTKFRHFFKCSLCSYSTSILKSLGKHYRSRHGKSAYIRFYSPLFNQNNMKPKSPVKDEETKETESLFEKAEDVQEKGTPQVRVYKCSICSYGSPYRRYLIAHFRNRHKFDTKAINKQMEKFKNWESTLPIGRFTCQKCIKVFFASKGRLLAHYETVHRIELKMDFTVVAERTHRTTGVYKCNRCKEKIFGIKNICKHLDQHRARLIKKNSQMMENKIVEASEENSPSSSAEDEMKLQLRSEKTIETPPMPTVSLSDVEAPEKPIEGKHFCLRCKRTFMSLKGLRSHERSHVAFAALDNMTTSESQEWVDKYIVYRSGTTRPYMCTLCSYRTTVLGLSKSHFVKTHLHVLRSAEVDKQFEEESQQIKDTAPNVADDLNVDGDEEPGNSFLEPPDVQRQLKHYTVMAQVDPASKTQDIQLGDSRMLPCEMCNFNSQHYSNMRRHYLRRHGKKLIRCKDCSFFTCSKQNLDLHEQMGHSCVQSEPTHQKNLCCPFCLYQSKNKNNMIDHIVLHREERMMPIEVRRSKLSRYLQGIVFRCYKCTFTSGSADSLDSHMAKHNDIKPFKCRLCYFDCAQLRDLEAHLCDKHQVVRNHQLVGQVSLDQLEEREHRSSQDDEDEVLHGPQNDEQLLMNEHPYEEKAENALKESERNEHILKDLMSHDVPNTQSLSRQTFGGFNDPTEDDDDDAQLDENIYDNQVQTKPGEEISESALGGMEEHHIEAQDISQNLRADAEDRKQIRVTGYMDDPMTDGVSAVNPNQKAKSNSEMQERFTEDTVDGVKNGMIPPSSVELQMSPEALRDQQSFGDVDSNPNDRHTQNQLNSSGESQYGEMPILEKYFKEQRFIFAQHCENSEKLCTKSRDECIEGAEMDTVEYHETQDPPILLATDCVPAVHSPIAAMMFPCDLCGRSLTNSSELQRHMMRHGM